MRPPDVDANNAAGAAAEEAVWRWAVEPVARGLSVPLAAGAAVVDVVAARGLWWVAVTAVRPFSTESSAWAELARQVERLVGAAAWSFIGRRSPRVIVVFTAGASPGVVAALSREYGVRVVVADADGALPPALAVADALGLPIPSPPGQPALLDRGALLALIADTCHLPPDSECLQRWAHGNPHWERSLEEEAAERTLPRLAAVLDPLTPLLARAIDIAAVASIVGDCAGDDEAARWGELSERLRPVWADGGSHAGGSDRRIIRPEWSIGADGVAVSLRTAPPPPDVRLVALRARLKAAHYPEAEASLVLCAAAHDARLITTNARAMRRLRDGQFGPSSPSDSPSGSPSGSPSAPRISPSAPVGVVAVDSLLISPRWLSGRQQPPQPSPRQQWQPPQQRQPPPPSPSSISSSPPQQQQTQTPSPQPQQGAERGAAEACTPEIRKPAVDCKVAVLTAHTSDYPLGDMCARVNKMYAARHGYAWLRRVLPPRDAANEARHPTWKKVELLVELLTLLVERQGLARVFLNEIGVDPSTTHLLWIDADAAVLRQHILGALSPADPHLVIGEDLTPACHVNAGVLLVKVSSWSLEVWRDVWGSHASEKFWTKPYHEQSGLLKQLSCRHEGLKQVSPFHSFAGGPGLKTFAHVCVLPRHAFNTNRGDTRASAPPPHARWSAGASSGGDRDLPPARVLPPASSGGDRDDDSRCDFIFHAAGMPCVWTDGGRCKHKADAMRAMLAHAGLPAGDGECSGLGADQLDPEREGSLSRRFSTEEGRRAALLEAEDSRPDVRGESCSSD